MKNSATLSIRNASPSALTRRIVRTHNLVTDGYEGSGGRRAPPFAFSSGLSACLCENPGTAAAATLERGAPSTAAAQSPPRVQAAHHVLRRRLSATLRP